MISKSLFLMPELNVSINESINFSVMQMGDQSKNPSFDLQNNLKTNLESSLHNWRSNFKTANASCPTCPNPPGYGFRVNFGLQILLDFKIRFKGNVGVGYGQRWGDVAGVAALNASIYNHGLGTAVNSRELVIDVTAATYLTVGGGKGTPLTTNTLNYNSPSPILNDFKNSFTYGQLVTWNSALNEKRFSPTDIQREGMIGFRLGDFNVSSNNDTKRLYQGGGTDKGWTGGLSIVTPLFEVGFQDFSGDFQKLEQEDKRDKLIDKIKNLKKSNGSSIELEALEGELLVLTKGKFHNQSSYQKSLNKASNYFRFKNNGSDLTIDLIGDAWLQNMIHKSIKDFKFEYNFHDTDIWSGQSF